MEAKPINITRVPTNVEKIKTPYIEVPITLCTNVGNSGFSKEFLKLDRHLNKLSREDRLRDSLTSETLEDLAKRLSSVIGKDLTHVSYSFKEYGKTHVLICENKSRNNTSLIRNLQSTVDGLMPSFYVDEEVIAIAFTSRYFTTDTSRFKVYVKPSKITTVTDFSALMCRAFKKMYLEGSREMMLLSSATIRDSVNTLLEWVHDEYIRVGDYGPEDMNNQAAYHTVNIVLDNVISLMALYFFLGNYDPEKELNEIIAIHDGMTSLLDTPINERDDGKIFRLLSVYATQIIRNIVLSGYSHHLDRYLTPEFNGDLRIDTIEQ